MPMHAYSQSYTNTHIHITTGDVDTLKGNYQTISHRMINMPKKHAITGTD